MIIRKTFLSIANQLFDILFKRIEKRYLKNIQFQRQVSALKTTVEYVEEHMSNVISKESKWDIHQYALSKVSLKGLFLEFGVYQGETVNYIAKRTSEIVYGFDSFEGLPEFWRDGFDKGILAWMLYLRWSKMSF